MTEYNIQNLKLILTYRGYYTNCNNSRFRGFI